MHFIRHILLVFMFLIGPLAALAQDDSLVIATIDRPPFSMDDNGQDTGFSVELWQLLAADIGVESQFRRVDDFGEMLRLVEAGEVDGAISNISITASREALVDFTQPVFESGLQIMIPYESGNNTILNALFTRDILYAILVAIAMLVGGGMLMWQFERGKQEYFDRPARDAMFPAFWWALNLVVNGGFEERVPTSRAGRVFAVMLVISSLFLVSIFVAKITSAMTLEAIQSSVNSITDIKGRRVGAPEGSTASQYLEANGVDYIPFEGWAETASAFERRDIDAVVFDGPILKYYVRTQARGKARVIDRVFRTENYGIALPTGSPLREDINRSLLRLREGGAYSELRSKWFGPQRR